VAGGVAGVPGPQDRLLAQCASQPALGALCRLVRKETTASSLPPFSTLLDIHIPALARVPLTQAVSGNAPPVRVGLSPELASEVEVLLELVKGNKSER
jgi:hypothetical protein